jgi:CPA2 family monovalent cation:H+ antiporter-2
MAVASTVVLLRVLLDHGILETTAGHAAVGWLIVEDILTVLVLVLIPALALESGGASALPLAIGTALFKIAALAALVLVAGGRIIPWVLVMVARLRSRELFTLTVLVIAIAIAAGSYAFFGVSMALGAFLAGMVVAQTPVSQQAGADALPMRDAFSVLFFVSVGMLFDPTFILREPALVIACLAIIMIGKPLAAFAIVALLGYSTKTALIIAISLAQIGEFSFILADAGRQAGVLPGEGHSTLVACSIVSITLNPLLFKLIGPIEAWIKKVPSLWLLLNARAERLQHAANAAAAAQITSQQDKPLAVVVGYGPVGRTVDRLLRGGGLETVVIDMNMDTILELRKEGRLAIFGDASHDAILTEAGIARAQYLVITLPHSANRTPMITVARQLNPNARIHVRARYLIERTELEQLGAHFVCFEEAESAISLARAMLAEFGATQEKIQSEVDTIREELGNRGSEAWRAT